MTNLVLWSSIVAFFAPPVIAVIQQSKWPNEVRAAVTFAAAVVAGAGVAYFQGDLTGRRWFESGMVILVASIATFHGFWKPIKVAPKIEELTSPAG